MPRPPLSSNDQIPASSLAMIKAAAKGGAVALDSAALPTAETQQAVTPTASVLLATTAKSAISDMLVSNSANSQTAKSLEAHTSMTATINPAVAGLADQYASPVRAALDEIGKPGEIRSGRAKASGTSTVRAFIAHHGETLPRPAPGAADAPIGSVADIGKRVRERRKAMKMTQQRFADLAGVGRRFLIELEHGKPTLEINRVLVVCQAAGIKLGFLA